jgi:hypothetical protein
MRALIYRAVRVFRDTTMVLRADDFSEGRLTHELCALWVSSVTIARGSSCICSTRGPSYSLRW